jgi:hypothetical protein
MKEMIFAVVGILIFFGMLIFSAVYDATMKEECRTIAMKQNYTAIEVQAICK